MKWAARQPAPGRSTFRAALRHVANPCLPDANQSAEPSRLFKHGTCQLQPGSSNAVRTPLHDRMISIAPNRRLHSHLRGAERQQRNNDAAHAPQQQRSAAPGVDSRDGQCCEEEGGSLAIDPIHSSVWSTVCHCAHHSSKRQLMPRFTRHAQLEESQDERH